MPQYELDTASLAKAIAQLQESLEYCHSDVVQSDPKLVLFMRAATIQAFEFTYELSLKMLKRYLELSSLEPQAIDLMSFQNLIRTACEQRLLLSDVAQWKRFRHYRSITSLTYDQEKAVEVFNGVPFFVKEALYLLEQLNSRIASA